MSDIERHLTDENFQKLREKYPGFGKLEILHSRIKYKRRKVVYDNLYKKQKGDLEYIDFILNKFDAHGLSSENNLFSIRRRILKDHLQGEYDDSDDIYAKNRKLIRAVQKNKDKADFPIKIIATSHDPIDQLLVMSVGGRKKDARDYVHLPCLLLSDHLSKLEVSNNNLYAYLLLETVFYPWEIIPDALAQEVWGYYKAKPESMWLIEPNDVTEKKTQGEIRRQVEKLVGDIVSRNWDFFADAVKEFYQIYSTHYANPAMNR